MALPVYLIPKRVSVHVTAAPLSMEEAGLSVVGDWQYPGYSATGSAYQPQQVSGDLVYAGYTASGFITDGAPFTPPIYLSPDVVNVKIHAEIPNISEFRISQPMAGEFNYSPYRMGGRIEYVGVGVGAWDYSPYQMGGSVLQNGAVTGDWEYRPYSLGGGSISGEIILEYPGYTLTGMGYSGFIGEWDYAPYQLDGAVVEVPDNAVDASLNYTPYELDGELLQTNFLTLTADYWSYSMSGFVALQYVTGVLTYPGYSMDGAAVQNGAVYGEWDYPTYEMSGSVEKYGFVGELNYPGYTMDGLVGFPGVGVGIWRYDLNYSMSGLITKADIRKRRQFMVIKRNGHD